MFYELMMRKKEEIMYATIKGTLTENDGVFSGFSASSYLQLQQNLDTSKPFEIVVKFTTDTLSLNNSILYESSYGFFIRMKYSSGRKIYIDLSHSTDSDIANNVGGQIALQDDTTYWLKFSFDLSKYVVSLSTDGINYTEDIIVNSTLTLKNSGHIDIGSREGTNTYVQGSIDLNRSYIKLGSTKYNLQAVVGYTVVGSPTITDGVLINPTSSNYLIIDKYLSADRIEVSIPFSFDTLNWNDIFWGKRNQQQNVLLEITSGGVMRIYFSQGISGYFDTARLNSNINYRIDITLTYDNFAYKIINEDSNIIVKEDLKERTTKAIPYLDIPCFGRNASNSKIAIKDTIIKADNKLWFNGQEA